MEDNQNTRLTHRYPKVRANTPQMTMLIKPWDAATLIPMEPSGNLLSERYEASVTEEADRFVSKAIFEGGQRVMLMLEKPDGEEHGYYISTARSPFNVLCCGTFIEKDTRKVNYSINKTGLSGTYDLRVIVDDEMFDTGIQITC